jgi:chondroitin 4-sulfotransferase 11
MLFNLKRLLFSFSGLERYLRMLQSKIPLLLKLKLSRAFESAYAAVEDENEVIFVHIPKAAGNGITISLFNLPSTGHYFAEKYKKDDSAKYKNYFKFTVVRNPWDRLVSAFHYLNSEKGGIGLWDKEFQLLYLNRLDDFKSFIDEMINNDEFKKKILLWTHFIPQHKFLCVDKELQLDFDFICRYETLGNDFNKLKVLLGKNDVQLKKVNKSDHKNYRNYYTEVYMIDFVSEVYRIDIELLNYEF